MKPFFWLLTKAHIVLADSYSSEKWRSVSLYTLNLSIYVSEPLPSRPFSVCFQLFCFDLNILNTVTTQSFLFSCNSVTESVTRVTIAGHGSKVKLREICIMLCPQEVMTKEMICNVTLLMDVSLISDLKYICLHDAGKFRRIAQPWLGILMLHRCTHDLKQVPLNTASHTINRIVPDFKLGWFFTAGWVDQGWICTNQSANLNQYNSSKKEVI